MMKRPSLAALLSVMVFACGSGNGGSQGSSNGDSGPSFFCYYASPNVSPTCAGSLNTPQGSIAGTQQACTEGDGQIMDVCPSAGLVGCCQSLSEPSPQETCYYGVSASAQQSQCTTGEPNYTWSTTSF